jgi:RNA polymerase sigma-70 factor (ECF subfamily)
VQITEIDHPHVPDGALALHERDEIERGFRRLDTNHRAVVVLHHYLDLTLPEVASALGIPLGTAKSRLHSALAQMRAALEADARVRPEVMEGHLV